MERLCPRFGDGVMAIRDIVQAAAGAGGDKLYVEDVFSTYLYDGNGANRSITNGIDLDGEGGLVWIKGRNNATTHTLHDTARGPTKRLRINTDAETTVTNLVTSFNSDGFSLGTDSGNSGGNFYSNSTYASWTWRKAPKFFDVVTWTGDDTTNRTHAHNLGSVPGLIIVKATSRSSNWTCYHRSLGNTKGLSLNSTDAAYNSTAWNSTSPTDTVFTATSSTVNEGGETYVAYVFAHDAGGFGDDGDQNVISCGTATTNGSGLATVTLGYEPQWLLVRNVAGGNWFLTDNMRGWATDASGADNLRYLSTESANQEYANAGRIITSTGFNFTAGSTPNSTYIYMAIRRPMKTPEAGTEVFAMDTQGGSSGKPNYKSGFPVDFAFVAETGGSGRLNSSRLTSPNAMYFNNTNAESSNTERTFDYQNGWGNSVDVDSTRYSWMFKRATAFMDVVCDTGTGSAKTETHNLGVVPELIIRKSRSNAGPYWLVGSTYLSFSNDEYLRLSTNDPTQVGGGSYWNSTAPTSSVFSVGNNSYSNGTNYTFVNYLFASLPGVSKVGSYSGTGGNVNVDCGFSAGARFILIKRTDPGSTGDWYVWDSVRGISAGNDPYILLNNALAQVTNTDYIDPLASGFTVTSSAPAALNASGGSYLFLAIA